MIKILFFLFSIFFMTQASAAKPIDNISLKKGQKINIVTTQGTITVTLFSQKDSSSADYFLKNIQAKSYDNTIFHRIVDGFVLQAGIYDASFQKKNTEPEKVPPIENRIKNHIYTLALIRDPKDTGLLTSQFFINLSNNTKLDEGENSHNYDVIGEVTSGFDVLQKMDRVRIGQREGLYNVPFYPEEVAIKTIQVVK